MKEKKTDLVIIGGSLGGVSAAMAAAKLGCKVILTEACEWIGGQVTNQAVPPDEHKWIEHFGCTTSYRRFRNKIRSYYRNNYPLVQSQGGVDHLNPGNAWVSRIAHEPRVALHVTYDMLAPYLSNGNIKILTPYEAVEAETEGDTIKSVSVKNKNTGDDVVLVARLFLDATDCGDLLPLTGTEYVTGAESRTQTNEPHALEQADPKDMQSITHVLAVDYIEGEDHTIERPEQYEFWKNYQAEFLNHKQLSWYGPDAETGNSKLFSMFPGDLEAPSLWDYRRIIDASLFEKGFYPGDISLINWPQNDYWKGSIIDVPTDIKEMHLSEAKQLSLSFLYWLQTEAPRKNGGYGYQGLRLRGDIVGTKDGLAQAPYIRESRRIKAMTTVTEHFINATLRDTIYRFNDSVGIGAYRIDLHPTTASNRVFYAPSLPFEIPLGALIPQRVRNLLPACKNIGTTQLTNGCFRLHPVEWNIGESVGYLAAFSIKKEVLPAQVHSTPSFLEDYQKLLQQYGISLHWPEIGPI